MAKELPYFRFTPQEWQNGDISLESYELKGLFIDVCSYYWVRDCSITKAKLKQRFSNAQALLNQLFELGFLGGGHKEDDFVEINFLNAQFDTLSKAREARQRAGRKGGKQSSSKAQAMLKQSSSYKDKDKDKDKESAGTNFSREREVLNHVSKFFDPKTIRNLSESDKTKWLDTIRLLHEKDGYRYEDISKAISFARQDEFWSGNVLSIPPLRSKKKGDVSKFEKIYTQMKRVEHSPKDDREIIKQAFRNKTYRPV